MELYETINTIIEFQDMYADIMLSLDNCEITPTINYYESVAVAKKAFFRMHLYIQDMEYIEITYTDNVLTLNGRISTIKEATMRLQGLNDMLTIIEENK